MTQEELQNLLNDLDKGLLGKPQVYWDRVFNLQLALQLRSKDPNQIKEWQKSVDRSKLNTKTNKARKNTSRKRAEERGQLKPVAAYTMEGKFVKQWSCIKDAAKELNCTPSNIRAVCRGTQRSAVSMIWKYM